MSAQMQRVCKQTQVLSSFPQKISVRFAPNFANTCSFTSEITKPICKNTFPRFFIFAIRYADDIVSAADSEGQLQVRLAVMFFMDRELTPNVQKSKTMVIKRAQKNVLG